jgi:hypothetical protein
VIRAAIAAAAAATLLAAAPAWADHEDTVAVIGDTPYGDAQIAGFPQDIAEINGDPDVRRVIHLGDIKNGSSRCDDSYLAARLADFATFDDPLVYTPGDNEWTDCHRANNGGYLPTERLATIRRTFFAEPGRTLGEHERKVDYQSRAFPENVTWDGSHVQFGLVHVVGSNDDQLPWFTDRPGQPETAAEQQLRVQEYTARERAGLAWVDAIFERAERSRAAGVVLGMQADMWDPAAPPATLSAFAPYKEVIARRAAEFGRPVLLMEGDSHVFTVDRPAGMPANLTRVVVQGSTSVPHEWLRLHVDRKSERVFSCEVIPFGGAEHACPAPLG